MYSTLHAAANAIRKRQTTPLQLVEQCLAAVDRWERRVRAWVFIDREGAIAEAKRLGQELEKGTYRGPLHGIPIGIKDIFDVFDWPTASWRATLRAHNFDPAAVGQSNTSKISLMPMGMP